MYFKSMDLQHYLLNNILKFKFLGYFWHEEIIMLYCSSSGFLSFYIENLDYEFEPFDIPLST